MRKTVELCVNGAPPTTGRLRTWGALGLAFETGEWIHKKEIAAICTCGRDEDAALTLLRWLKEGDFGLGTSPVALPPETPSIAALAV